MPTVELNGKNDTVDEDRFLEATTIWTDDGACRVAGLPKPTGCV